MQWDERFLNELRALLPEYMAQKRIVVGTRGKKLISPVFDIFIEQFRTIYSRNNNFSL